jgi:hypothetical protein
MAVPVQESICPPTHRWGVSRERCMGNPSDGAAQWGDTKDSRSSSTPVWRLSGEPHQEVPCSTSSGPELAAIQPGLMALR